MRISYLGLDTSTNRGILDVHVNGVSQRTLVTQDELRAIADELKRISDVMLQENARVQHFNEIEELIMNGKKVEAIKRMRQVPQVISGDENRSPIGLLEAKLIVELIDRMRAPIRIGKPSIESAGVSAAQVEAHYPRPCIIRDNPEDRS